MYPTDQTRMYPFIIFWQKQVFACLDFYDRYGNCFLAINFWYPTISYSFLPKDKNFVADKPDYPDTSAPWVKCDEDEWDEIPF